MAFAVTAYITANVLEFLVEQFSRLNLPDVIEISDVLLAAAAGVTAYLWLHLRSTRSDLLRLERRQITVDTQLATAAKIQRHLLPAQPGALETLKCAVGFEPAWEIGGDFYDFLPLGPDVMLVVIGDISGKGIPAAMLLALARTVLRTGAARTTDPGELLGQLSDALYEDNGGSPYATCIVARVDAGEGTVTYANAGHPTGVIVGPDGLRLLDHGGPPAGMFRGTRYASGSQPLRPGDLGVLVTDGISELDGQNRSPAALLADLVAAMPGPRTPAIVCDAILRYARAVDGPPGTDNWSDDRTVLAFQWLGPTAERLTSAQRADDSARAPRIHRGTVSSTNTTTDAPAAVDLSIPKSTSPAAQES
jgi:sigma-B regulation protein RsbU (phosphoserine phosphatase)